MVPVAGARRRRAHVQDAGRAIGHGGAIRRQQSGLGARHRRARRARATRPRPVGEDHEDGLRRAEPVEDLDAEARAPALVHLRRQALARGHAGAHRAERVGRQRGAQHPRVERRHREEQRRPERRHGARDGVGLGPVLLQVRARAGEERDQQRVAERVSEEQLGGRERPVRLRGAQHVDGVVPAREQVAMRVDGRLRPAGRARRVEPEGAGLAAHGLHRERVRRARLQRFQARGIAAAGDDHVRRVRQRAELRREVAQPRGVGDEHARAAVGEHRRPVGGGKPGVQRDGHDADAEGTEEDRRPRERIGQQQCHALPGRQAEATQRIARPAGQREQIGVGRRRLGRDDGGTRAPAGGDVVVEERGHRVGHGRVDGHNTIGGWRRMLRTRATCQTMKTTRLRTTQTPAARQWAGSASSRASRPSAVARAT